MMIQAVEWNVLNLGMNALTFPNCLEQSQQKHEVYLTAGVLFCSYIFRLNELTGGRYICVMGEGSERILWCWVGIRKL